MNWRPKQFLFIPLVLSLFLLAGSKKLFGQNYQVSLLTCAPGEELYSSFGHNAIRLLDLDTGRDLVFNYGTFDFDTPNFYLKFARGKLDYMLSVSTYEQFVQYYTYMQRGVREQVLDLSPEQALRAAAFLQTNYKPENRYYRYDFFFDNCATRIRDMMETVLGDQLKWDEDFDAEEKTFRNLIDEYVYPLPWADFGIDLALGSVIDRPTTDREKQFLPDYMEVAFSKATIIGNGPSRPLVKSTNIVLDIDNPGTQASLFNPYLVLWLITLMGILVTYFGYKQKKLYLGLDLILFAVCGLIGFVILFLWFFTDHSATAFNWNILWAFPLHLVLVFGLRSSYPREWVKKYLLFAMILTDIAIVVWIFGWQSFHPSILPLMLLIILRTNFLYYNLERFKLNKKKN